MIESWVVNDDSCGPVSSEMVLETLRSRRRSLAFVTNTERAMVMLLEEESDPGEHAVDPGAQRSSDGFVLSDGQDDEYPDEDTVPIREAFRLVKHIVGTGFWPTDARWVLDR
ncbi:hypothetical protein ACFVOK_18435 [Streptomyces sp. NPDC057798]|uniref:hypothetical protein n=1 Tax=Streptomyces sp. NPDC057798 TaxID=3346252 RepID=UPI0036AD86E2